MSRLDDQKRSRGRAKFNVYVHVRLYKFDHLKSVLTFSIRFEHVRECYILLEYVIIQIVPNHNSTLQLSTLEIRKYLCPIKTTNFSDNIRVLRFDLILLYLLKCINSHVSLN